MPPRKKRISSTRKKKKQSPSVKLGSTYKSTLIDNDHNKKDPLDVFASEDECCQCRICIRADKLLKACQCTICHRARQSTFVTSTRYDINDDLKVIPLEIWSMVWRYLSSWELGKIMRTCKLFHDSAAPTLYKRVIITDPSQLFYGLDHSPKNGRLSKIELISSIRNLYFAYDKIKVPRNNKWIEYADKLDHWESLTGLSYKLEQFHESIKQLDNFLSNTKRFKSINLFKKLKTVSFGYRQKIYFNDWEYLEDFESESRDWRNLDIDSSYPFQQRRINIGLVWMDKINQSMNPIHICREVCNGPFGVGYALEEKYRYNNRSVPHTHTLHYSARHLRGEINPNIIMGTLNRWILEDIKLEDFMIPEVPHDFMEEEDNMIEAFHWIYLTTIDPLQKHGYPPKIVSREDVYTERPETTIRIYSNLDWHRIKRNSEIFSHHPLTPLIDECRLEIEPPETDRIGEKMKVRLISPILVESNVKVELMEMKDAGTCPACGACGAMGLCPSN